ncbi:MAG: ATP-binding protein [Deltaproteobacteria bacterium]|nr:ATP-binding protein [Deltaproteobacteria bacterium]
MVQRTFWLKLLESAWSRKSIVWLAGVRRVGKTFLCQSIPNIEYFDCELPRIRRQMEDPEDFLEKLKGKKVVLDEIHRLPNPSEILKIASDHFPSLKLIATGSSTLQASSRFRDTLAGRKAQLWLTPMMSADLIDFGNPDLPHRLLRGGLPPFFLNPELVEIEFQEWIDSFWAKDIQELFRLERRNSFQRFMELLFIQSGGLFEATRFAAPCEVSRSTISNYLSALEATWVIQVIRPFSTRRSVEIISAPKTYAFDTGFVCFFRGWQQIREDDLGLLWEHWVLNEMQSHLQAPIVQYWRDKRGHEVDFVLNFRGKNPIAIECKWKAEHFASKNLRAFRSQYPEGQNWIICQDVTRGYTRSYDKLKVEFIGLEEMSGRLDRLGQQPRTR